MCICVSQCVCVCACAHAVSPKVSKMKEGKGQVTFGGNSMGERELNRKKNVLPHKQQRASLYRLQDIYTIRCWYYTSNSLVAGSCDILM